MGALITLGILVALAVLPLGISFRFGEAGPLVKVIAGPVKFTVFPMPKKNPKKKKDKAGPAPEKPDLQNREPAIPQPPKPPQEQKSEPEKGGSILDFIPLVELVFRFLGDFRRKLRIRQLKLKLILAGDDPCDLAVNYGRAWAAVGNLLPKLDKWFVIRNRDVEVACDFAAAETLVIAHVELTVTLGRLLWLLAVYGVRAVKEFLTIRKKRKGGAVT